MILKAFSIRDAKGDFFHTPFMFFETVGMAEREFHRLCNDDKSQVYQYPEDYDLYQIGTLDNGTGKFESLDTPQHLVKAVQMKVGAAAF